MWNKCSDDKSFMICGRAGQDATYKQVGSDNKSLTTFSVCVGEKPNAEGGTDPIWTNCECWHAVARAAQSIKKGDMVFAIGIIKTDEWTDKQTGEPKQAKKLVCDYLDILPLTASRAPAQNSVPAQAPAAAPSELNGKNAVVQPPVDDYPF